MDWISMKTYELFQELTGYFMFYVTQNQIKSPQIKSNVNKLKSRVIISPDFISLFLSHVKFFVFSFLMLLTRIW